MNLSPIEWLQGGFTWNPITGCPRPKVSPGCANCYAERITNTRLRHLPRYQLGDDEPFQGLTFHDDRLLQPLARKKPSRIFVCSMGDMFHELADDGWLAEIFAVMAMCPQHTFLLLTKRPERMRDFIIGEENDGGLMLSEAMDRICPKAGISRDGISISWPLPNVWLGVTICNQAEADEKIPILLDTPAAKRYVSVEPMLGPVNIARWHPKGSEGHWMGQCRKCGYICDSTYLCEEDYWSGEGSDLPCPACGYDPTNVKNYVGHRTDLGRLSWVICGGETGPGARPMHPDWARGLRDQCVAAGTPFFFKGWGEWIKVEYKDYPDWQRRDRGRGIFSNLDPVRGWFWNMDAAWRPDGQGGMKKIYGTDLMHRINKRRTGRLLDGREWNEVPS